MNRIVFDVVGTLPQQSVDVVVVAPDRSSHQVALIRYVHGPAEPWLIEHYGELRCRCPGPLCRRRGCPGARRSLHILR